MVHKTILDPLSSVSPELFHKNLSNDAIRYFTLNVIFRIKNVFKIVNLPYQMHNHIVYFCNVASEVDSFVSQCFCYTWINASWYQNNVCKFVCILVYMYIYMLSTLCCEIYWTNRVMFRKIKLRSKYSFVARMNMQSIRFWLIIQLLKVSWCTSLFELRKMQL